MFDIIIALDADKSQGSDSVPIYILKTFNIFPPSFFFQKNFLKSLTLSFRGGEIHEDCHLLLDMQ